MGSEEEAAARAALRLKEGGAEGVTPMRLGLLGVIELACALFAVASSIGWLPGTGGVPELEEPWSFPPLAGRVGLAFMVRFNSSKVFLSNRELK